MTETRLSDSLSLGSTSRVAHNVDDPFTHFSSQPLKSMSRLRPFTRRSKYRVMAEMRGTREPMGSSHDPLGSNSNLGSLSCRSRLDAHRMISMQEDAHHRRISSEVMKKRLYETVVPPRGHQRRYSMQLDSGMAWDGGMLAYAIQSLPATPVHSRPHSPTDRGRFAFGLYSRGATPRGATPSDEDMREVDEEDEGLASLFSPRPRLIPAVGRTSFGDGRDGREVNGLVLGPPPELAERLDAALAERLAHSQPDEC